MSKFKVGQRVKYISEYEYDEACLEGEMGEVIQLDHPDQRDRVLIQFDNEIFNWDGEELSDEGRWWCPESYIAVLGKSNDNSDILL